MNLTIFDIDGVLTNTLDLDDEIYIETIYELFFKKIEKNKFEKYKFAAKGADSGVTIEFFKEEFDIDPTIEEINNVKSIFIKNLKNRSLDYPELFKEIPGSSKFFKNLQVREDIALGIATGSWQESGIIKLDSIGIEIEGIFYGNSDDFNNKFDIVKHVIQQAKEFEIDGFYENIFYIGDSIWDAMAAKELEIEFIGIDSAQNGALVNAGCNRVFRDFLHDRENILDVIFHS